MIIYNVGKHIDFPEIGELSRFQANVSYAIILFPRILSDVNIITDQTDCVTQWNHEILKSESGGYYRITLSRG